MIWKDRQLRMSLRSQKTSLQNHPSHVFPILNLDYGGGVDMISDAFMVRVACQFG